MTVLDQLVKIYYEYEWWHRTKMPLKEAYKYHRNLLEKGNILYYEENNEILGYCEVWKVTSEQLGRISYGFSFSAYFENVKDGDIAYLANLWINPKVRHTHTIKILKLLFFKYVEGCRYITGEEKNHNKFRIFINKRIREV